MEWVWDYAKQQGPLVVLLAFNIWALVRGWVITKAHKDDLMREKDDQIRKAELREQEHKRIAAGLTDVFMDVAPVVRKALREESSPR